MKQRIFSFIILAAMLISLAGPAQAQAPASVRDPQALLWVSVPDEQALQRFGASGLPAYTTLLQGQEGRYLLSGADRLGQQALADAGLAYRILDADLRGAAYYLASPAPGQAAPQWASFGRLLLDDGTLVLLRMDAKSAEALALAGGDLQALTLTPKALAPRQTESVFPQAITPDPMVAYLLSQITQDMIYNDTADISGERPVEIGGVPYTILTRNTNSGEPIQKATQFIGQELAALGLEVEYHQWSGATYPNVIGEIPGLLNPDEIYIIGAHLDDMPSSGRAPGADDNASGSVATLIAARLFSQYQWGCTLRFAFWTGEEQGLLGSAAYATRADNLDENILGYLNLDMIAWNDGGSVPNIDLIYNPNMPTTLALAQLFSDVIDAYDLNLIPEFRTSLSGGSDHSSFWNHGYTSILAIEDQSDFNPYYHTINDDMGNFEDWPYYLDFVKASVGTIAHMSSCMLSSGIGNLDGTVSAQNDGAPIEDATLQIASASGPTIELTTDASGYYTQTLLSGPYTVTASSYGYLPVITTTLVITDQTTTLDFSLPDAPVYTITGIVQEAGTGLPLGAGIEVLDAPVPPASADPFTGAYTLSLAEGSYTLRVNAPGHRPQERLVTVDQSQTQDFYLLPLPCILLVDDDNNSPDTLPYYSAALDALGYDYDVFDVGGGSGSGPSLDTLQGYRIVIWFSGDKYGGVSAGPNASDEANLTAYLQDGGRLFLDAQDYLYDMGNTAFAQTYLGVGSFTSDTGDATTKYGVAGNPVGDGLGPLPLNYPLGFSDYGDIVNPGAGASSAFRSAAGSGNSLDLTKASGSWKTVFFGTSWVPIYNSNNTNGTTVLERILQYFGGCPACTPASIDDLTSSSPVTLGETMYFTATVSGSEPLMYLWEFGGAGTPGGAEALANFTYDAPGVYPVQVSALNACGVDTAAITVTVEQPSCDPVTQTGFSWLPGDPLMGQAIAFTATATGTLPITFTWDFGDGSPLAEGITATHTFAASGTYTVTLTAANPCGQQFVQQALNVVPLWKVYLPLVGLHGNDE